MTTISKTMNVQFLDFCIRPKQANKQDRFEAYKDGKSITYPIKYQVDSKGVVEPETIKIEGLEIPSDRIVYMNSTQIQYCFPECYKKYAHDRFSHIVIKESMGTFFVYLVHKESFTFNKY